MTLSVLIHTFNGYQHLWPGQWLAFCVHWYEDIPVFFGTDNPNEETVHYGKMITSGPGEWSDRLINLLHQIPSEYVLYMQEDHYPTAKPPDLLTMVGIMKAHNLLRLQISPVVHFYKLTGSGEILFFDPYSKYLVSHQPSIWNKSFLLDCLKPGETPWVNEYKGTLRLQQTSQIRDFIRNKIAIFPCEWYKHMCIKGKVVENG